MKKPQTDYDKSKKNIRNVRRHELEALKISSTVERMEQITTDIYVVYFYGDATPYLYKAKVER